MEAHKDASEPAEMGHYIRWLRLTLTGFAVEWDKKPARSFCHSLSVKVALCE